MHLTDLQVAKLLDRGVSDLERGRIEDHLSDCEECAARVADTYRSFEKTPRVKAPSLDPSILREAMELGGSEAGMGTIQDRVVAFLPPASWRLAALAAVVVVVVGIGTWMVRQPGPEDAFRFAKHPATITISAPGDGETITDGLIRLEWEEVSGIPVYDVFLYTSQGELVWQGSSEAAEITVPVKNLLLPGKRYLWRVEASSREGLKISSELFSFQYVP